MITRTSQRSTMVTLVLSAAVGAATITSVSAAVSPFDPDDTYRVRTAGDVQLSPDGARIVFIERSADRAANRGRSQMWLAGGSDTLKTDVQRAKDATDAFVAWLESQTPSKTGTSGTGVENYDWYLKHVQLVP